MVVKGYFPRRSESLNCGSELILFKRIFLDTPFHGLVSKSFIDNTGYIHPLYHPARCSRPAYPSCTLCEFHCWYKQVRIVYAERIYTVLSIVQIKFRGKSLSDPSDLRTLLLQNGKPPSRLIGAPVMFTDFQGTAKAVTAAAIAHPRPKRNTVCIDETSRSMTCSRYSAGTFWLMAVISSAAMILT